MTEEEKKIHDLKFELRQQRRRIDVLEEHIMAVDKAITNILKNQLAEVKLVNAIVEDVGNLMSERKGG